MSESERPDWLARHWKALVLAIWLAACVWFIVQRWSAIHWFALGDTDDNMRMMQVRALLNGQDWYDLRQYRLNPPEGFDMHWSRLVDLPIAAILLVARLFVTGPQAETAAIALAPLIPLGVALAGLAVTIRRLVNPSAAILAGLFVLQISAMNMFMPARIDHHGWQMAMLTWVIAGLADKKRLRGGLTIGTATALSLVIGLETLPWLAVAGAGVAMRWIVNGEQAPRLRGYAISLGGGVTAGFLIFASEANRVPRCDALTPVWLSTMLVAAAALFLLSSIKAERHRTRLALAAGAGAAAAAFFMLTWPDCIGRPEQVSPELQRLWLSNISEARPVYTRNWPTILSASVALLGLGGAIWMSWRHRREELGIAWATIMLLSLGSVLILAWQVRGVPTALMFSMPGAAALAWAIVPKLRANTSVLVRTLGVVAAILLVSGLWVQLFAGVLPDKDRGSAYLKAVGKANARCPTIPSLAPIARMPRQTIFTFVDLGPRLITLTHHNAIAGPYHRNGGAILDVHHAFRGSPEEARAIMRRHGATMLLVCPNLSESTIYRAQAKNGFYAQLSNGKTPSWLEPVTLPANSPYRLWRIKP